MAAYLIGIDAGNTMVKAVLFDQSGKEIAVEHRDGGTRQPRPHYVERDIDDLRRCAIEAIRGCIERAGIAPSAILAIGCAGHGNGVYLLDSDRNGVLGVQSLDSRAAALVRTLRQDGTSARMYEIAFQKPWPAQTATLLAWLQRNAEDAYRRSAHVLFCKDVIVEFLTGQIQTDRSDASGGGLLNLRTRDYDEALLTLLDLDDVRGKLPPLAESTDVAGRVSAVAARETGLAQGTPVVSGLFDVVASALGSGVAAPGQASIVAGTWSINQVVVDAPIFDPGIFMAATFRPDRFMAIEASATSATNLEWFVREEMAECIATLGKAATLDLCSRLVSGIELRSDLPMYHPYLYGSIGDSGARGAFFGIGGWHNRGHLIHAVMEGVAFAHRKHIEKLKSAGADVQMAMLSGGAARSKPWAEIFADVLGIEIRTSSVRESGALGVAMAAGIGVGLFPDFETATKHTKVEDVFEPREGNVRVRSSRFKAFSALEEAVRPVWAELEHDA